MPLLRRNRPVRVPPLNKQDAFQRAGKGVVGAFLPVFQRENLAEHMDAVINADPKIYAAVKADPRNYNLLAETVKAKYDASKGYLRGAKVIDTWDRVTSAGGLVAEAYVGPGTLLSVAEEVVETVPKMLYGLYYVAKTGDYKAIPYFTFMEAASFIPIIGDLIDMKNIYVNRARKRFRREVKESFLEKLANTPRLDRIMWN